MPMSNKTAVCVFLSFHPASLIGTFCIALPIFLGVYLGAVVPNNRERSHDIETTCFYTNATATPYTCCDKTDCQCSECPQAAPSCSAARLALTAGPCCDGFHCCQTHCDECCEWVQERESYRCCTGSSSSKSCSTCYRTVRRRHCHTCNCRCVRSVDDQFCHIVCGTCHSLAARLHVRVGSGTFEHVMAGTCARDASFCAESWLSRLRPGVDHTCYYDNRDPGGAVRWAPRARNTAAVVFAVLFAIPLGLWALVALSAAFSGLLDCATTAATARARRPSRVDATPSPPHSPTYPSKPPLPPFTPPRPTEASDAPPPSYFDVVR